MIDPSVIPPISEGPIPAIDAVPLRKLPKACVMAEAAAAEDIAALSVPWFRVDVTAD